ncbi:alpha/beta hydrolase [Ruegeria arenilitoris]|uniref:alpha/beta hydrolase n=1 Tax=Ruegeria arenilitoris TaxID=1173585 RepID=UPI00147C9D58|nr:alpha/beta hydrolase [Ruegeria arenilitoris]
MARRKPTKLFQINFGVRTYPILTALMIFVLVASCGRTPDLIGVDNPKLPTATIADASRQKIFIMTTREASDVVDVFYNDERAPEVGLASVVVSIPPIHVPGQLEAPKRLPPDPRKEFAVIDPVVYETDSAFVKDINRELSKRAPVDRTIMFFVHGYNNTTSEAVLRMAQFVEDTNFNGIPILFTWASGAKPAKYVYDLNSALVAREKLKPTFEIVARTNARTVDIFAHSMGSLLVMEGIVQADLSGRFNRTGRLGSVVLASPDIDIDLFRSQLRQIETDFSRIFVLVAKDDRILRISRTLSGGVERVGSSDLAQLKDLGVVVIDLSQVDDSAAGSHTKFAGSPELVQLIGRGLKARQLNPDVPAGSLGGMLAGVPIRIIAD